MLGRILHSFCTIYLRTSMRGVGRQWCMELAVRGDHLTFANVLKQPRSKLCNWAANFLVHSRFGKPENALGVNFIHSVCEVYSHICKKIKSM